MLNKIKIPLTPKVEIRIGIKPFFWCFTDEYVAVESNGKQMIQIKIISAWASVM